MKQKTYKLKREIEVVTTDQAIFVGDLVLDKYNNIKLIEKENQLFGSDATNQKRIYLIKINKLIVYG